ncbi:MAG: 50S ribosomal protein L4 [bacterium]|nr:50S ribosomal protein L4 [bacterium]
MKAKKLSGDLPEEIFAVPVNAQLLAQFMRVYWANQRQGTASTKTRGEVSGGGRKPWRQKGTGRARQGSIRSPLWRHGGVAHGPQPRDWSLNLPRATRLQALRQSLSAKAKDSAVILVNEIPAMEISTQTVADYLSGLTEAKKILVIVPQISRELALSARNLTEVQVVSAANLTAEKVLICQALILTKDCLPILKERLG